MNGVILIIVFTLTLLGLSRVGKNKSVVIVIKILLAVAVYGVYAFISLADDEELALVGLKSTPIGIESVSTDCEAILVSDTIKPKNYQIVADDVYYLTSASTLQDIDNFIKEYGAFTLQLKTSDGVLQYEHSFKSSTKGNEIKTIYDEWQSTGKVDIGESRVYLGTVYFNRH